MVTLRACVWSAVLDAKVLARLENVDVCSCHMLRKRRSAHAEALPTFMRRVASS